MADETPDKVQRQIEKLKLPRAGKIAFVPKLVKNRRGQVEIKKDAVVYGPRKGRIGYVDVDGRIWIKDYAHADCPDHWDVQISGGRDYVRVDFDGNPLP